MIQRIVTAIIAVPLLIWVIVQGGWILYAALSLVTAIAIHEYGNAVNREEQHVNPAFLILLSLFMMSTFYYFESFIVMGLILSVFFAIADRMIKGKTHVYSMLLSIWSLLYLPFFLGHLLLISKFETGNLYIWLVFIICFGTDTFAYFTGMAIGKRKLAPKISPKKSVEGAVGGILGSVVLTVIFYKATETIPGMDLSLSAYIAIAVLGSGVSQLGDLTASIIKRSFSIKDFGRLLPGHGGILDRFDSVIFASPFIYYAIRFFM
ncbi:MAG TPA: phosphatidate cytidylyltransferase [Eubacteriaceae bacterium]|nr:phosphatidate cytidylyltransferase [Eubacteriaceae bacterium]